MMTEVFAAVVRDRLGLLCEQLSRFPELEGELRDADGSEALDALVAAVADNAAPDWTRLNDWINEIDAAARRTGLAYIADRLRGKPAEAPEVWGCPRGYCDRASSPNDMPGDPMICWVAGSVPLSKLPTRLRPSTDVDQEIR